jgi:cellulose 1,4-beta-cellobiosidase
VSEIGAAAAPAAPTGLRATGGSAKVTLSWNSAAGVESYNIYRGTSAGHESPVPIATGVSTTNFADSGLTNGTTYYYVVQSVGLGGRSRASNEASATPYAPLLAPKNMKAAPGSGQATLTWSPVSGAGWYTVKLSKASGGPYTTSLAKVTGTTATVTMLSNGVTYYFVASAGNRFTTGPNSSQVSARPGPAGAGGKVQDR